MYVWTSLGEPKVGTSFAICPTKVVRKDDNVSKTMAAGFSRLPEYSITRLAIDVILHGMDRDTANRCS